MPAKPTAAELRHHSIAAASAAEKTIVSLNRLARQKAEQPAVRRLVFDYERLRALYAAASARGLKPKNVPMLARAVSVAEETTVGDARARGLPGCAPHPSGV